MSYGELEDPSLHRLEGISESGGGLQLKVKKEPVDEEVQVSIWGLDKLAKIKREEKERLRRYRTHADETPSSGVSDTIRSNIARY